MIKPTKTKKPRTKRTNDMLRILIVGVSALITFLMLAYTVTPSQYDIKVGDFAPTILKATKDVVDEISTKENQDKAEALIETVTKKVDDTETMRQKAVGDAEAAFKKLREAVNQIKGEEIPVDEEALANVNESLKLFNMEISLDELKALAAAESETLTGLYDKTEGLISAKMGEQIFEEKLPAAKEELKAKLREKGEDGKNLSEDETLLGVFDRMIDAFVTYNYEYDLKATETRKQEARDNAAVVKYVTGQVIVEDGKPITEKQYAVLKSLGMVDDSEFNVWLYIGIAILILALLFAIGVYLYLYQRDIYKSPKRLLIIALSCIITLLLCILAKEINLHVGETQVYIMPVSLAILLIALLVNARAALFINLPLSILASMLSGSSGSFFDISTYTMVISSFVSGCAALTVLRKKQTRLNVLFAGIAAGFANIITTFSLFMISTSMISASSILSSLYISLYAGIGGPLSAIICIALMPAFEAVFNVITTTRLVEMSNPNQPLLRRLLLEAPGTYHHSIIVANLAEAAAAEIGANSLLARVGAYYHDIGKLMRPRYFTENQMGDNPHDRTDPRVSTAIITAHTKDGAQLLKEKRIPEEIKNIALTHHGDTPVVYFYNKALGENADADVADFRYPGPKPSTKEEAIVMMADSVEAATRAIPNPDRERVREVVDKLISQKIDDGQLDDCDLSFRDISRMENAFITVLSGAFHERIEYPTVDIPKKHGEEQETATNAGNH